MSVENKIRVGFGLALAFLLLTSVASFWSATRSVENFRAVEHSQRVLEQLAATLGAMVDVETGARGFALSGQEEFLEPFNEGRERARTALGDLRRVTANDPVQQKNLDALEPLYNQRLAGAVRLVDTRNSIGIDAAAAEASRSAGRELMEAIRRKILEMERVERQLLIQRSTDAEATFQATMLILSLSGLLAVMVVGIASMVVHRDFEKRQKAEEERDQFFHLSLDLFCIAGFDGYFKSLNPAWEKTLGYTCEELKARPYLEFIHPDDLPATLAEAEKMSHGEPAISFANRYRCKDGSYRWLLWTATPIVGRGLIYASARDMTDQKRAEEEIGKLNADLVVHAEQLSEANAELEAFSYSVSHDLRAPLRHIDGFVNRLKQTSEKVLDQKGRHYIDIISDSAKQMGILIDDLLVFSRMARAELCRRTVNLEAVTQEVIAMYDQEARPRKIKWKNGHLPEVEGDPSMLKQVMVNLISNAVKYTRMREDAEIEIGWREGSQETIVFVRDNGVGFDMEYAHKLFGVFQRLHRSDEFEGTGIGLANVRRIIHRHGGRAWAEGKPNAGATFYFSLPKNRKEHRESPQAHSAGGRQ